MCTSFAQLPIAAPQSQTQFLLQLLKVGQFPLNVTQLLFQSAAHRRARLQATSPQPREVANLFEREPQALHPPDERQRLNVGFCVFAESTWRSCGMGK
jgi:hypothetical protein